MAEVTRVPLQPIASGSLSRLWIGLVVLAVLAALAALWTPRPAVVEVEELSAGTGAFPSETDVVFVNYTGTLDDGTVFDESQSPGWPVPGILPDATPMALDQVVPGFREAILKMQRGGSYKIKIPAEKAYGDAPPPESKVPPGADLNFDVTVIEFMTREEAEQRYAAMISALGQMENPNGAAPGPVQ